MKTCIYCGKDLNRKALDIPRMMNKEEREKLYAVRKKSNVCSMCNTDRLLANLK